ncbi:MAG: TadE family protein [Paracoccaceae bacterium]
MHHIKTFQRETAGTTLVELAVVLPLFLLIFFGLIDFGRMGAEYVMAEKAMQRAARIAVVRPPVCVGVPNVHQRGPVPNNTIAPRFGTMCRTGNSICANVATVTCSGSVADPTASEIWNSISAWMPTTATPANLSFSYAYDSQLGFLGGPYTPIVTVEIQALNFQFTSPLSGFAALAGSTATNVPSGTIPFPSMSVSLPAEDLALGNNG